MGRGACAARGFFFEKPRHAAGVRAGRLEGGDAQMHLSGVAHRAQGSGANLYPVDGAEDNPIEPPPDPESSAKL